MENLEIIFENFRKDQLDKFVFDELKINSYEVKSSHFFDSNRQEDIEFHQIKSIEELLSPVGTGNVLLEQIEIGSILNDVMIIFSFDNDSGDITFNFSESELFEGNVSEIKLKAMKIVESLISLKDKYDITKIRIGFEPATDDDSCLVEIGTEKVDLERAVGQILS
ncbi:hypothetical protein [Paenibacillus lactis]|uniref:Uncharacterized protein n=1 Tax=Paenibacillus lactis 154 TaxID=743719 RepID=G4HIY2_9BACL|nr:hypothetical protein [Paenibacillus lactis]EHB62700.1 hypothetical protein PaelaDRAFT_3943 [Paenibacillus lactis 154]